LFEEAIENEDVSLPRSHPFRTEPRSMLADAYIDDDRNEEATKLLEHVLEVTRSSYAASDPTILSLLQRLALLYFFRGETEKAVKMMEHVAAVYLRTGEGNSLFQFKSWNMLVVVYLHNNQLEKAAELLEVLVSTEEWKHMENDLRRLSLLLGSVYFRAGQREDGVKLAEHVVRLRGEVLAEDHSAHVHSQHTLAIMYEGTGRLEEAIQLLSHVVAVRKRILP
ncbi:TPR-like protein, partial [Colletotrichum eremochloae]